MRLHRVARTGLSLGLVFAAAHARADDFTWSEPGDLVSGSGTGRADATVYAPGIRFPIELAPAYLNSQVWGHGGLNGPGGGQCDVENFSYPWWDNFCETRTWDMPLCPSGTGHQGQDIRASSCADDTHWVVATEAGIITSIGSYTVTLRGDSGSTWRFMHLAAASLTVAEGDRVARGERLGRVSDNFGDSSTTRHLHLDLQQTVAGLGTVFVPPYLSLVRAYETLLGAPPATCETLGTAGGVIDNSSPCFQLFGPPATWRYVTTAGNNGDLHWTYAWANATPGNYARWSIVVPEAGTWRVEFNTVSEYAGSEVALYTLRHATTDTDFTLNLAGPDRWIPLGEYRLEPGREQWLEVYDNTGETTAQQRRIIADAVRVTRVDTTPVEDTIEDAADAAELGDTTADTADTPTPDTTTDETGDATGDETEVDPYDVPQDDAPDSDPGDLDPNDGDSAEVPTDADLDAPAVEVDTTPTEDTNPAPDANDAESATDSESATDAVVSRDAGTGRDVPTLSPEAAACACASTPRAADDPSFVLLGLVLLGQRRRSVAAAALRRSLRT